MSARNGNIIYVTVITPTADLQLPARMGLFLTHTLVLLFIIPVNSNMKIIGYISENVSNILAQI